LQKIFWPHSIVCNRACYRRS